MMVQGPHHCGSQHLEIIFCHCNTTGYLDNISIYISTV
jgi:hypothetical protein